MKVSVIIPTHNRSDALALTLNRLAIQEFQEPWEAIVINNNCTDDTDEIVSEAQRNFPVPLKLIHEKTPGAAAARNAGVRIAKGEYVVFIDNDILTEPDFLKRHIGRLRERPGCWVVGLVTNLAEQQATNFGKFHKHVFPVPTETGIMESESITGANSSLPRADFLRLDGFDENFHVASGEDREMSMRAKAIGIRILFDSSIAVVHNDWAGSSIRDFCLRQRLYVQTEPFFWRKYGDTHYRIQMVRENLPPNLKTDGIRLFVWKNIKRLFATNTGQRMLIGACETVEKVLPTPAILWRLYRMALAGAVYRGFQEGLAIQEQNKSLDRAISSSKL